jgi:hypothetical protein
VPEKVVCRPFSECFRDSDGVTACHILWEEYCINERKWNPGEIGISLKMSAYMLMEKYWGPAGWRDSKGNAGYHKEFCLGEQSV